MNEKRIYLNLDDNGYLLSTFSLIQSGDDVEVSAPYINSLDGLDLSGDRIMAYHWNGEELVFDEDKYADISGETQRRENEEQKAARKVVARNEITDAVLTAAINTIEVDDSTALRWIDFYPEWASGVSYTATFKVQHGDRLWRCMQGHTSQAGWEPENTPALWEEICETHSGELDDPIPYNNNMRLEVGKYYTQFDVVYRCTRDTGVPVYNNLSDLVGLYVELI